MTGATVTGRSRYVKEKENAKIGEGTFGVVFKAVDTLTNLTVAIKKIRLGNFREGVNVTALREIKLLKELRHENVIRLVDVFPHKQNLNLVFEFMESDLEAVIQDRNILLSPGDVKSYMQMTLRGLAFCHKKWVLHRDMKPNNLLIGANGELKLADFGLARIFGSPDRKLTHQVFARWYRAPELLYGSKFYGPGVDVWGAACVFAELMLRRPFMQGSSDIDQLGKIFAALGTPLDSQWPEMRSLPDFVEFHFSPAVPLKQYFPAASEDCLDLLGKMWAFDPNRRITAQKALEHRYFIMGPPPTPPSCLPKPSKPMAASQTLPPPITEPLHEPLALSPAHKAARLGDHAAPGGKSRMDTFRGEDVLRMRSFSEVKGEGDEGGKEVSMGAVGTPGVPMSVDTTARGAVSRPTLNSSDKQYLRKRKLDMDLEFESHASRGEL